MGPRILFFGYSEVGHDCLALLLERGDNVVALVTHEDNPHEKIWFKTPALAARERGIPVFTPESVNTPEWREQIAALAPATRSAVIAASALRFGYASATARSRERLPARLVSAPVSALMAVASPGLAAAATCAVQARLRAAITAPDI